MLAKDELSLVQSEIEKEFDEQDDQRRGEWEGGCTDEKEPAEDVGLTRIHEVLQAASPLWLEDTSGIHWIGTAVQSLHYAAIH